MAHVRRIRPGGDFYLISHRNGKRVYTNLKTSDPAEAERERIEATALEKHMSWRDIDLSRYDSMPGRCRLSKQNYHLAARTMGILGASSQFDFLLKPYPRLTTLAELGRVKADSILYLLAAEICARQMPSKQAVRGIRKFSGTQ